MIHVMRDVATREMRYVISKRGVRMPGSFESELAAQVAEHLDPDALRRLQEGAIPGEAITLRMVGDFLGTSRAIQEYAEALDAHLKRRGDAVTRDVGGSKP